MSVDVMVVYDRLDPFVVNAMRRFPSARRHWETIMDLKNDYIAYFMEKGFDEKYDEKQLFLYKYIWMGLRNFVINTLFKNRIKVDVVEEAEFLSLELADSRATPEELYLDELLVNSILGMLPDKDTFSKVKEGGESYNLSCRGVFKLFFLGHTQADLARKYVVSRVRISQIVQKSKRILRAAVDNGSFGR